MIKTNPRQAGDVSPLRFCIWRAGDVSPLVSSAPSVEKIGGKASALLKISAQWPELIPPFFVVLPDESVNPLQIASAVSCLSRGELLAVRSSGPEEDQVSQSCAGLFKSILNVEPHEVALSIDEVRQSGAHRQTNLSVIVQQQINPDCSGVAFARHPEHDDDQIWIGTVAGHCAPLVAGKANPQVHVLGKEGVILAPGSPLLSEDQAMEIAARVGELSDFFGHPQDVEWAIASGRLWILQSRPLTTGQHGSGIALPQDLDRRSAQSNYPGILTPLTFSIVQFSQRELHRHALIRQGASETDLAHCEPLLNQTFTSIAGRAYYNRSVWLRIRNTCGLENPSWARGQRLKMHVAWQRWQDQRQVDTVVSLAMQRVDQLHHLSWSDDLDSLARAEQILIRSLAQLLHAVVVNDSLIEHEETSVGNIDRARMIHALEHLAAQVGTDSDLARLLNEGTEAEIQVALSSRPEIHCPWNRFLEEHGELAPEEFKLDSLSWRESPLELFRLMGQLALMPARPQARIEPPKSDTSCRLRDRENLRLARARLFGRLRSLTRFMGQRFHALGWIALPEDIHFLTREEILSLLHSRADLTCLQSQIDSRKDAHQHWAKMPEPEALALPSTDNARQGIGCSSGQASGPVWHVKDFTSLPPPGAILVSRSASPEQSRWLPLVAGLVLEEGNLFAHLAILARERGLPLIARVEHATQWLRDGETVWIDGASGIVRREAS